MNRGYYHPRKVGLGAALGVAVPAGLFAAAGVGLTLVVAARSHAFDERLLAGVALGAPWLVALAAMLAAAGVCRIARVRWHALALSCVGGCAVVATATGWLARAIVVARSATDTTWPPDAHAASSGLIAAARHGLVEVASSSPMAIALVALEALLIVAASVWLARRWLGSPVCRGCGSWCPAQKGSGWAFAPAPEDAARALRARDWAALQRGTEAAKGPRRVRLDLQICARCGHLRAMNAWWVRPVMGGVKLVTDMLLAEDEVRAIRELGTAGRAAD